MKHFLKLVFLFIPLTMMAQEYRTPEMDKPTAFAGNYKVDHARGLLHYNIPLMTVEQDGFELPLQLTYTSNNYKWYNFPRSEAWALSAGGIISRSVMGKDDFKNTGSINELLLDAEYLKSVKKGEVDGEYDVFRANFVGHSCLFVMEYDNATGKHYPLTLDKTDMLIEYNKPSEGSFQIIDENGIIYEFEEKTVTSAQDYNNSFDMPDTELEYTISWQLSRIILTNGSNIEFSYSGYDGSGSSAIQIETLTSFDTHYTIDEGVKLYVTQKHYQDPSILQQEYLNALNRETNRLYQLKASTAEVFRQGQYMMAGISGNDYLSDAIVNQIGNAIQESQNKELLKINYEMQEQFNILNSLSERLAELGTWVDNGGHDSYYNSVWGIVPNYFSDWSTDPFEKDQDKSYASIDYEFNSNFILGVNDPRPILTINGIISRLEESYFGDRILNVKREISEIKGEKFLIKKIGNRFERYDASGNKIMDVSLIYFNSADEMLLNEVNYNYINDNGKKEKEQIKLSYWHTEGHTGLFNKNHLKEEIVIYSDDKYGRGRENLYPKQDYFGGYNGQSETAFSLVNLSRNYSGLFESMIHLANDSQNPYSINTDSVKLNALKEVELPGGGIISFDYEPNSISNGVGINKNLGGIRIKEINVSNSNGLTNSINYNYNDENGSSTGYLDPSAFIKYDKTISYKNGTEGSPFYVSDDVMSLSPNPVLNINVHSRGNNGVWYEYVEEITEGKGKVIYNFMPSLGYNDDYGYGETNGTLLYKYYVSENNRLLKQEYWYYEIGKENPYMTKTFLGSLNEHDFRSYLNEVSITEDTPERKNNHRSDPVSYNPSLLFKPFYEEGNETLLETLEIPDYNIDTWLESLPFNKEEYTMGHSRFIAHNTSFVEVFVKSTPYDDFKNAYQYRLKPVVDSNLRNYFFVLNRKKRLKRKEVHHLDGSFTMPAFYSGTPIGNVIPDNHPSIVNLTSTEFQYNGASKVRPSSNLTSNSKGETILVRNKYANDYSLDPGHPVTLMSELNQVGIPIETQTWLKKPNNSYHLLSSNITDFTKVTKESKDFILPSAQYTSYQNIGDLVPEIQQTNDFNQNSGFSSVFAYSSDFYRNNLELTYDTSLDKKVAVLKKRENNGLETVYKRDATTGDVLFEAICENPNLIDCRNHYCKEDIAHESATAGDLEILEAFNSACTEYLGSAYGFSNLGADLRQNLVTISEYYESLLYGNSNDFGEVIYSLFEDWIGLSEGLLDGNIKWVAETSFRKSNDLFYAYHNIYDPIYQTLEANPEYPQIKYYNVYLYSLIRLFSFYNGGHTNSIPPDNFSSLLHRVNQHDPIPKESEGDVFKSLNRLMILLNEPPAYLTPAPLSVEIENPNVDSEIYLKAVIKPTSNSLQVKYKAIYNDNSESAEQTINTTVEPDSWALVNIPINFSNIGNLNNLNKIEVDYSAIMNTNNTGVGTVVLHPKLPVYSCRSFNSMGLLSHEYSQNEWLTSYVYDSSGRLEEIRDNEGNILKDINYNTRIKQSEFNLQVTPKSLKVGDWSYASCHDVKIKSDFPCTLSCDNPNVLLSNNYCSAGESKINVLVNVTKKGLQNKTIATITVDNGQITKLIPINDYGSSDISVLLLFRSFYENQTTQNGYATVGHDLSKVTGFTNEFEENVGHEIKYSSYSEGGGVELIDKNTNHNWHYKLEISKNDYLDVKLCYPDGSELWDYNYPVPEDNFELQQPGEYTLKFYNRVESEPIGEIPIVITRVN